MHDNLTKNPLLIVGILLCAVLAACGRKGPLEPPPGTVMESQQQQDKPKQKKEDRRIILDALI